ncbi:cytochrome P450, partial [Spirulina sp. 06S082]|uniref:cytochrome P450 n=1 Tax=Spirulina sp. 06S082 TaxID=3110248 RepID=UPI002B21FACB
MKKLTATPKSPYLVQLLNWTLNPIEYLEKLSIEFGDIFQLRFSPTRSIVLVSDPEGIETIFASDEKLFNAGGNVVLRPFLGDNSLLTLSGQRHKQHRKLIMPSFHGERMKSYGEIICQITREVFAEIQSQTTFSTRAKMQEITLEVILQTIFGLQKGGQYDNIKELLLSFLKIFSSPLRSLIIFFPILQKDLGKWSPGGRVIEGREQLYHLLQAEIEERRKNPDLLGEDILSLMMSAKDENGESLEDLELKEEMITLLFAGHETTATSLAWAFYWIHRCPEIREKILQELETLGNNPEPDLIAKLPYLNAVCKETLRIYPIIPIALPRTNKFPLDLMGYHFEPETRFAPCIYLLHHREDLYPDSKQFKPERFLECQYSPYEYIPLGGGRRRCMGYAMALYEMKLTIATVPQNHSLELLEA